jgi:predicted enzyme related to lactoylglutathione lyase
MHARFCWNELMTADVEKAKAYYAAVLGWTYTESPMPDGTYTLAHAAEGGDPVAGIFPWPEENGPTGWFAYIEVTSVDEIVARTPAAGGKVMRGPWPIPGVGRIALVTDASGAGIGFLEPEKM